MPKKGSDRRKGRRKRPPHSSTNNTTTAPVSTAKTSPQQTRGRSTKNSRHGRTNPPRSSSAVPTTIPKKPTSLRNRKARSNHSPDQPIYFTSPDGELYKPGEFAYVDSQQSDLPFHICLIRSFKLARKESVVAEVKWFYRVTELPEAVYCLLMEDRKKGTNAASFELPGVNERELFTAFNIDTHPASLFRGKCVVSEISDINDLAEHMSKPDCFFYQYGYKPESRRITQLDEFSIIPHSQQAVLPETIVSNEPLAQQQSSGVLSIVKSEFTSSHSSLPTVAALQEEKKVSPSPSVDRYSGAGLDEKIKGNEQLVWYPAIDDDRLLMYLRAARSVALHAGVFINGLMRDGYMAASSDETTQHAFDVLHKFGYNTETSLLNIVKKPIVHRLYNKKNWSKENSLLFAKGMRQFGKNFYKIKKELLPNKEIYELVEYYYYWKKTNAGLSSRSTRKQRKQTHIKMSRIAYKQPEVSPEREYIDLSSASEDEVDNEDGDKCLSFHACRHCFTTVSPSWHHSGNNRAILCDDCRLHFQRYGFLRKLASKRDPPDFMFKDYHLALAEESGRKTRNSNGIRLPRTGLRNGKVFSKSDSDEDDEGEITDISEFSTDSTTDLHHSVSNPKALPSRRSLLDLLQPEKSKPGSTSSLPSSSNTSVEEGEVTSEQPPNKKPKIEENEGNDSEDEISGDSTTNGEGEDDPEAEGDDNRRHQLQEEKESSSRSPGSSSNMDDSRNISHVPSVHTPSANATLNKDLLLEPTQEPVFDSVPQQFKRVREDSDFTCARTDLIYVHPPAHEKKAIIDPQKTLPAHLPPLTFNPTPVLQPPPPQPIPAPLTSTANHPLGPTPSSSSALPPHILSSQSRPTGVVPTITPHDPALPTFINLPGPPPPITPVGGSGPFVSHAVIPPPPQHGNDREKEMLWNIRKQQQQQQQQIELAQHAAATHSHHLPPGIHFHPPPPGAPGGHVHPPPGTAGIPVSQQQQQQLIFQFPNMEEVARAQRHGGGIPEGLTILPAGPQFPQLVTASGLPLEARPPDDGQPLQGIQYALHPIDMVQQQLLLQQHQQPVVSHLPEAMELQQQVESIVQEYQKDPTIMLHPHVREILAQYQATQNNMYLQQQQQQMQEIMMHQLQQQQQQEVLKQQHKQQQQQQKYHHQQAGSSGSAAMRPGVIISNSK